MSDQTEVFYPDEFMAKLQITWGQGFLSPGGPEETALYIQVGSAWR